MSRQTDTETDYGRIMNSLASRRRFLAGTAAIGSAALAGCSGGDGDGGAMTTEEPTDTPMSTETPMDEEETTEEMPHPDVDVLNYALTLEHLEHAFYRDGLKELSDLQLRNADVLSEFGDEVRDSVPMRLKTVRDHEKAHVDAIAKTVKKLGGTPVEEAEYTFEYDSPSKFIATAQVLENTGVAAYAGAAPTVKNDKVFGAAAAIHSVEARHAGFLNELNGDSPYPDAVDQAKPMSEVKEAVKPFIK